MSAGAGGRQERQRSQGLSLTTAPIKAQLRCHLLYSTFLACPTKTPDPTESCKVFNTLVIVLYNQVPVTSLWAPRSWADAASSVCIFVLQLLAPCLAEGVAAGDGNRHLGIAFSLYSPGKGCSECPGLPGAGKPSNRIARMGLHESLPGGAAWSRRGLGSEPQVRGDKLASWG